MFEREDPNLKFLPLAVQQKQIIVTCNYEARRRGLYKLQLVKEARKKCPDVGAPVVVPLKAPRSFSCFLEILESVVDSA